MGTAMMKLCGRSEMLEADVNLAKNTVQLNGKRHPADNLRLDIPVQGTVYGTLLNYNGALSGLGDAVHETPYQEKPKAPILYIKPRNTLTGSKMSIPIPENVAELEMGAALAVVIGRTATRVKEEEALDHVEGYTIANDVSIPHVSYYRPATHQKARDGFCPAGPWMMAREAVTNPDALGMRVWIDGELRQKNNTANLIRSVPRLIADVTEFMTLYKGDTLLTGVPESAPLAKAGQRVRIEIDEIGYLENTLIHEQKWAMGGIL